MNVLGFGRRWLLWMVVTLSLGGAAHAQLTRLWTVERFENVERGMTAGAAIRGDGRIEAGPESMLIGTTGGSFVWSVAAGRSGESFAGVGGGSAGSAALLQLALNGTQTKAWSGAELAVQAVRVAPDGSVLFTTNPDGKLYRLASGGAAEVLFDPATTAEKPKYLWDLAVVDGAVYVAAGAPAAVYRVSLTGTPSPTLLFKTADQHIRCLAPGPGGLLWAGSDGAGVIYRIALGQPGTKPFAAYAAPRREITALALGPDGTVYAAGVGARGPSTLPPLPVTGAVGISVTFLTPGSASAASTNTIVPDGSEIYRIAPDGAPSRLATLKDDVVYGLALLPGTGLLAATGNHGRIFRLNPAGSAAGESALTDYVHLEAGQATALADTPTGLLVATANAGKLFRVAHTPAADGTYTSEVFDAKGFAHWGRAEVRLGSAGYRLELRTGNVPSSVEGWSDWITAGPDGRVDVPDARFAQWRVRLNPGGQVAGVSIDYLPRNIVPVIDEVFAQTGARVAPSTPPASSPTVAVQSPAPTPAPANDNLSTPLTAQRDRTAVTVRWSAHDDNGDDLLFALYVRGEGEKTWRLLKDRLTDRYWSFDTALLPDGTYTPKVEANDGPAHTDQDTLTGERIGEPFTIDTTPPVPGTFTTVLAGGSVHATFSARDALSPISRAEYSLDGGDWQFLTPVGVISDALEERYDFTVALPPGKPAPEHVFAIRIYDRYDNSVSVKQVIR